MLTTQNLKTLFRIVKNIVIIIIMECASKVKDGMQNLEVLKVGPANIGSAMSCNSIPVVTNELWPRQHSGTGQESCPPF